MSKTRIYELAKELGVDNKVVIAKANELGMKGKKSHSNSLEGDEADQIRRALIRQAVEPDQERLRTRVNRDTGEESTVVERRRGNIIRRRKKSGEEAAAEEAAVEEAEETATIEEPPAETIETPAEEIPVSTEVETSTESVEEEVVPEVVEEVEEPVQVEEPVVPEVQPDEVPVVNAEQVHKNDSKGAGPKVLGKISLPVERVKTKTEDKKKAKTTSLSSSSDEDDRKGKGGKGRRSRKREFSRGDLVDYDGRGPRRPTRGGKGRRGDKRGEVEQETTEITQPKASKRIIKMAEGISVGDLAKQLSMKAGEIIGKLIENGMMVTINQVLDQDTVEIIADDFGFTVESTEFDETIVLEEEEDPEGSLAERAPVVTVMGHVDHGKTSLLDFIRSAGVAGKEHGGITQHIGAYSVELESKKKITFLDTPGHAAFTSMRARGASVTDIVILVVAADDGVMPQTIEAINHAKAAGVPIVVAVNKMDKADAQPDRVKQQLSEHGLQPEDWGGDTMYYPVSALKGEGVTELLEGLLVIAELAELKANPDKHARGTIVEAQVERGRGTVATILVGSGTLKVGDIFVSGAEFGRVRSMKDHLGRSVEIAGPSDPVEITGLNGIPEAGDDFLVVENDAKARQVAENRKELKLKKERAALASGPVSLEEFSRRASEEAAAELNVIIKADVDGSLGALKESLEKLSTEKVRVRVLHSAVGGVNESDVQLALASKAFIVGFNVRAESRAMADAEEVGIDIRFYRVIYELLDDIKAAMTGLLAPIEREVSLGRAEVRETFSVPKIGLIAGCYILDGKVKRGSKLRLVRDSVVVHEGPMLNLRRFKEDVKEVQSGYECGISFDGYNDVKTGDVIEAYEIEQIAATLE